MSSHEAGSARTHMLLVIISNSLSLLDAFWLKHDLFSFLHKIEMMHLSMLPAVTCGIQTITKGRLCDFHQHFENTLYLLSPTEVVFYEKVTIYCKNEYFHKNTEFLIGYTLNCSSCVGLSPSWNVLQQNRLSCNTMFPWTFSSSRMCPWHFLNSGGSFLFWSRQLTNSSACLNQCVFAWVFFFFLLYPVHSSEQEQIDSCFFLLPAGIINDRRVTIWKL